MNSGIKNLLEKLLLTQEISNFIETGTMYGETSSWASKLFNKVFTIEKNEHFFKLAKKKFESSNVTCINGESPECLNLLLNNNDEKTIFWLDAHWSGGETSGEERECPIIEEIKVINNWGCECIIVIDDARLFLSPPYKPHKPDHWPNIIEIINQLIDNYEKYIVIIHDVIIVVPLRLKFIVEEFCVNENTKMWENRTLAVSRNISHLRRLKLKMKRMLMYVNVK